MQLLVSQSVSQFVATNLLSQPYLSPATRHRYVVPEIVSFVSPTHGHEIFGRVYKAKRSSSKDGRKAPPTIVHVYGGPCVQFVTNRCAY